MGGGGGSQNRRIEKKKNELCKDVIRNSSDRIPVPKGFTKLQHQSRLPRPHGAADADGEGALRPIAAFEDRELACEV